MRATRPSSIGQTSPKASVIRRTRSLRHAAPPMSSHWRSADQDRPSQCRVSEHLSFRPRIYRYHGRSSASLRQRTVAGERQNNDHLVECPRKMHRGRARMPRLSRGWPSRPPCPRPASQGGKTSKSDTRTACPRGETNSGIGINILDALLSWKMTRAAAMTSPARLRSSTLLYQGTAIRPRDGLPSISTSKWGTAFSTGRF